MCNTFIPIATLPTAVLRTPLQIPGRTPGLLSEQTSKRPIATLPSPVVRSPAPASAEPFCQNRQASAHGPRASSPLLYYQQLRCSLLLRPWIPGKLLSEQTSKHPVNKGFQSLLLDSPQLHYAHQPLRALDALGNFCQNSQASSYPQVIHSLWQSYPQLCPMNFQAWPKNLGPRSI